jgi:small-conductance mechanosensitive channel
MPLRAVVLLAAVLLLHCFAHTPCLAAGRSLGVAVVAAAPARSDSQAIAPGAPALARSIGKPSPVIAPADSRVARYSKPGDRFSAALDAVTDKLLRLLAATPLLLVAIAIVLVAAWLGRVASNRMQWLRRFRSPNPYMDGLVRGIVRSMILLAGILLALDLLGATSLVGAVLGSAGVVGLVLGFAFKDIAENYIAGILLSLRRPFAPGDHVQIENREGKVVALTSRSTLLMTLDGNQLRLPNALVFKAVILNYSHNPKRRFDFSVTIDAGESIRRSQALALAEIGKVEGVLGDPGPSWLVHEYTPAGIVLRFFGWIDQHHSDLGKVRSEAIRVVKGAFAKAGIEAPHATSHVILHREPGTAAAGETEPGHDDMQADTSVNRDIDRQLAAAQDASGGDNLLEGGARNP